MHVLPSLAVSGRDHLDLIRRLDRKHSWATLSDQRYCTDCHEVFSARDLEITGGTRALGRLRLQCATPGCTSSPDAWLPVGDRRTVRRVVSATRHIAHARERARQLRRSISFARAFPQPKRQTSPLQALIKACRKFVARLKVVPAPMQCGGIPCDQVS